MSLLEKINSPEDVKKLNLKEMEALSLEIRNCIIDTISKTGGHLAANLGVVELTIALLKVFSPPEDKIVWDTSHQTYPYKILTGRRQNFHTIRKYGGLSGFLHRAESKYDVFGAGHAGTALSAAVGIAAARDHAGGREHVVAIVGDGAAGCGISFEALNNIVSSTGKIIVILNDNRMSIDANVGAMSRYLGSLLANPLYNRIKSNLEKGALRMKMGWLRSFYYKIEEIIKSLFVKNILFEELGLRYVGPIDGHNLSSLIDAFKIAAESPKPILLHVATQKGKGYEFAENKPEKWHGTLAFDIESGETIDPPEYPSFSKIFGRTLLKMAASNKRIVAITAAMKLGTGLDEFAKRFPNRFYDVGICEEHAIVFAAGLAVGGMLPVVAIYSSFFQRAVDCFIHDVCLQKLPVILCLDRAGVVGEDGPTHHGVFDISLLKSVPDFVFMQPYDEVELADMLYSAVNYNMPVVIRYPRGGGSGKEIHEHLNLIPIGKAQVILKKESNVQIWALGERVNVALKAAEKLSSKGIQAGVINARFIKPIDIDLLKMQIPATSLFVTIENGVRSGGFGEGIAVELLKNGYSGKIFNVGWPDNFVPHGSIDILEKEYGQTASDIASQIQNILERE